MNGSTFTLFITGVVALSIQASWANDRPGSVAHWNDSELRFDSNIRDLLGIGSKEDGSPLAGGSGTGMQSAADHVIAQQCIDGGWGWPHDDCSVTYNNITGPIALGLLRAYEFTNDPSHLAAAVAGGDFDLTSQYGNGEARFGTGTLAFLHQLSAVSGDSTYSSFAETEFFDELTASTYGPSDYDTAGWIGAVEAARTGVWINLRPWEFHNIIHIATVIGNTGQAALFTQGVLDGLNTLDNSNPATAYSDLIGLSGGVSGLALGGTTSFTAIVSPLHSGINGIDNLCSLTAQLISYQNGNGSWYWHSNLASPDSTDQDTQTTAYAILALINAQNAGCGSYTTEIDSARAWIRTMQQMDGGFLSYPTGTSNTEVEGEATWALTPETSLALTPSPSVCYQVGDKITVEIDMTDATDLIVGGQFFLEYDNSVLDFNSATTGDAPFTVEVFESVNEGAGTIDYAVGVPGGGPGTSSDSTLAVISFTTLSEVCDTANLVSFRAHFPPTRLTNDLAVGILITPAQLNAISIDSTNPVFTTSCPLADINVNSDAGTCEAASTTVNPTVATATDSCDPAPVVTFVRSDTKLNLSDSYEAIDSPITITWTATDCSGNFSECVQIVTVNAVNELLLDVDLSPSVDTPLTRCITLELWSCPDTIPVEIVELELTSTGGAFSEMVEIPCGNYTCITVRDSLHTLRRTLEPVISGTQWVADYAGGGQDLIGGNLNDDFFIDILDFGAFVGQFGDNVGASDCLTTPLHADISGNGTVGVEDFTFISLNFLAESDSNCCGTANASGGKGPITRISVLELRHLGLIDLIQADLNHDGWLDTLDIIEFLNGSLPELSHHQP